MTTKFRIGIALIGVSLVATATLSACASASKGTRPEDMSAAGHDRAAVAAMQWSSVTSPTTRDRDEQQQATVVAAQHRSAAKALRDAEASSCAGIADADRDLSPFAHHSDIEGVKVLYGSAPTQNGSHERAEIGATIHFRAIPNLTRESLQKVIDCHLARNAALGNVSAATEFHCPLALKAVRANVRSAESGFDVDISSEDPKASAEVWTRAQRLHD